MRNWKKIMRMVVVAGLVWLWVDALQSHPTSLPESSLPRVGSGEPKTITFEQMERIVLVLESTLTPYRLIELRFPASPEEMLHSPYLPVAHQDLINPYSGKPIEVVQGLWKTEREFVDYFKGIRSPPEVPRSHLGNLAFTDFGNRYLVELYTEPYLYRDKVRISLYFFIGKNRIDLKDYPTLRMTRENYEKLNGPDFFTRMKDTDKRLFSICGYLFQFIGSFKSPLNHFITLKEWQKNAPRLYVDIKNPYTNLPVEEVSYFNPSPGNFTLIFVANVYDNTFLPPDLLCYDDRGGYMHHANINIEDPTEEEKKGYRVILH